MRRSRGGLRSMFADFSNALISPWLHPWSGWKVPQRPSTCISAGVEPRPVECIVLDNEPAWQECISRTNSHCAASYGALARGHS
eukprot:127535-Amphidinium_carterae.1